jgi:hypothetical protein
MSLNLGYSILNISIKNYLEPDAKAIWKLQNKL